METQSSVRQAGTTPVVLSSPRVGFRPIKLLKATGTRPEPAVSVPSANVTWPFATATAEPELDPPEIYRSSYTLEQAPNGERVPTNPVANWSMLVLPIRIAPASTSRCTTVALEAGLSGLCLHSGFQRDGAAATGGRRSDADPRARPYQSGCELVHVGFADQNRSSVHQSLHHRRAGSRSVGISRTARRRRHPRNINIVFHREGHSGESKQGRIFYFVCPRQRLLSRHQGNPNRVEWLPIQTVINSSDLFRNLHGAASGRNASNICPEETSDPGAQCNLSTVPALGATTAISVFIASSTRSFCPASTFCPISTPIVHTLAPIGERTGLQPSGVSNSFRDTPSASRGSAKSACPAAPQRSRSASKACCCLALNPAASAWIDFKNARYSRKR